MASVDEKLLPATSFSDQGSSGDGSAERAGALKEAQEADPSEEEQLDENMEEAKRSAIVKQNAAATAQKASPVSEKSLSAGTSKLLVAAWRNIILSFGFSFLYVYVHLFLKNVFGGKYFVPLGSEWFDKPGNPMAARDRLGSKFKIPEMMLVLLVSLIILFAIISIMSLLALLLEVAKNPLGVAAKSAELVWGWVENAVSRIKN